MALDYQVAQSAEPNALTNAPREQTRGVTYRPHVDIVETSEALVVHADLPGVAPNDIDINFEKGTLTIHASVLPRQATDTKYLMNEYGVGDYYRSFEVAESVDAERIKADYQAGVLTLTMPKHDSHRARKIAVSSN